MRRFELVEGTSSKFWEVKVENSELTVTFGRIGTNGQSKSKTFASNTAALAEKAKLIKEKTGKGYREVSTEDGSATAEPTLPPTVGAAKAPPAPPSAAPTDIEWPTGGFEWTDELRAKLPIVRGVHVPEFKPPTGSWAKPPRFLGQQPYPYHAARIKKYRDSLAEQGLAPPAEPWTEAEARERLTPDLLRGADRDYWRELALQCFYCDSKHHFAWALEAALELHGPAFATRWLLEFEAEPAGPSVFGLYRATENYRPLRNALAAAPEDEYLTARQIGETYRGRTQLLDRIVSFLFPEMAEWAEACATQTPAGADGWQLLRWLDHTALSVEAARRECLRDATISCGYALPIALLQIHLHGEAALPFLEEMLDKGWAKYDKLGVLKLIARLRAPAVISALSARFESMEVRAVLDKFAERWPAACLLSALECAATSRSGPLEDWIMRLTLRRPECVEPALAACTAAARDRYAALAASVAAPDEAPAEALPEVLKNPPWTRADRPRPPPILDLIPLEQPEEMRWPEGLRERWLNPELDSYLEYTFNSKRQKEPELTRDLWGLRRLGLAESVHARVIAGEPPSREDFRNQDFYLFEPLVLPHLSHKTAQAVWDGVPASLWHTWSVDRVLRTLFAQRELEALPRLLEFATTRPQPGLSLALPFRSARFAPIAAHALRNLKQARTDALAWLHAHPETAITALIPPAFGPDRMPRDNAQAALRWLAQNGFETEARRLAATYGEAAAEAVDRLLKTDPLWIVPARMPKLPAFFVPATLRRPILKSGGALPLSAVEHLGRMLTISTLHEPYAGLEAVKAACTPESLAGFAWDVFEAWLASGAPSKESWALTALGLLGDDETARRLVPKIREWSDGSAHARAVAGLDFLAAIGSDVAMQRLSGLANKAGSKPLRDKARQKLADIAEARGLSEEELADRLVPELGLDEHGTLELDFGPRRFIVGFDEALQPYVKDESGARLKNLPAPSKKTDNLEQARAAAERYKALKKDAKAIASQQIERLRKIMTSRRRWSGGDFRMLFLDHPLMRHLTRRLVWGVYQGEALVDAFRVAEDLTLADRRDEFYELPADVEIGLVLAPEMPEDLRRDFGQIFADYEIAQPFRQLGREVYTLNETERRSGEITRFVGKRIAGGNLMALANRGWEENGRDNGLPGRSLRKWVADGVAVVLGIARLTSCSGSEWSEPDQELGKLVALRHGSGERISVADLSPLAFSEAMRDVDLLPSLNK